MPSEPLPAFPGHPDRPLDPPPELTGRKKESKGILVADAASAIAGVVSGSLFDQLEPPSAPTAAHDAAATPSTAAPENPTQTDASKQGLGTSGMGLSAVEPPVQHDSVNASPGV
jgi:hypothetical protein